MSINGESKNLKEIFNEALELRDLDVEKLAELTDIPVNYLVALSDGDLSKLPASPYIRGYLFKIAETLKIDIDLLLKAYKQELPLWPVKVSGGEDKLPSNRYAFKFFSKKTIIIATIILLLIIGFLIWRFSNFFGMPRIEVFSPASNNLIVATSSIELSGKIDPRDKLVINNEELLAQVNGQFEKNFPLQIGINTIEFKVKRFLGKEIKIIRQVIYQP